MKFRDISSSIVTESDYTRADADYDDFMDGFWKWINDEVVDGEYWVSAYTALENADVDEEPWIAFEDALEKVVKPEKHKGTSELVVVDRDDEKAFIQAVNKGDVEAAVKMTKTIDDLADSEDLKSDYADGVDYARDPYAYNGVPRPSLR